MLMYDRNQTSIVKQSSMKNKFKKEKKLIFFCHRNIDAHKRLLRTIIHKWDNLKEMNKFSDRKQETESWRNAKYEQTGD